MVTNKLKVQAFRANDLSEDTGKQFELGKSWCDFFDIDQNVGDITFKLCFKPLSKAHENLVDHEIDLHLSAPTNRNDRKAYANGARSGYSAIKEFFLIDLHLNWTNNSNDYFAVYKASGNNYYLYYVPKLLHDNFIKFFESINPIVSISRTKDEQNNLKKTLQKIYFGTPGSGKSWTIKKEYEMIKQGEDYVYDEEKTKRVIRTTFHPDTDYASFVGCYKPIKDEEDEKKIVYEFVPQAFTDAYVAAWNDLEHPYYLIIEEINRGNCAQIFGDLFQLLDRNKDGYSEYPIKADHDLRDYLEEHLPNDSEGIKDGKLCLPPNLSLIASMNTSDQSLFPMDSAFKRRWSWEYVPIDYNNEKSGAFTLTIDGKEYNWHEFLRAVNEKIKAVTSSEDKQMGNFFIKNSINEKEFCDKVMFYLWSEIGKDNYKTNDAIFRYYAEEDKLKEFSFNELYEQSKRTEILKGFIRYIEEEKKV